MAYVLPVTVLPGQVFKFFNSSCGEGKREHCMVSSYYYYNQEVVEDMIWNKTLSTAACYCRRGHFLNIDSKRAARAPSNTTPPRQKKKVNTVGRRFDGRKRQTKEP